MHPTLNVLISPATIHIHCIICSYYLINCIIVFVFTAIGDPTNQSAVTSPPIEKECDMKTMHKYVVNKLAPHWTTVGDYLEYSVRERNGFKGADDKKSLIALLENWIGTDSGMKPKTWSTFIRVLTELDQDFSISVGNEICARLESELSITVGISSGKLPYTVYS